MSSPSGMSNLNELRTRISDLSRLALGLHSGSHQELFDSLQGKIGRVMKAFAIHEHDIVRQQDHEQSLMIRLDKCNDTRDNALQKLAALEIQHSKISKQKVTAESKSDSLSKQNENLSTTVMWEKKLRVTCENKLAKMSDAFEAQNAKIKKAQALTEANLQQLHKWLKDERLQNAALKDMNSEFKLSIESLEQTVETLTDEVNELSRIKQEKDRLMEQLEQLQKEKLHLQSLLDVEKSENVKMTTQNVNFSDKCEQHEREKQQLAAELSDLDRQLKDSEKEVMIQKSKCDQLQKENNTVEKHLSQKRDICASLQIELNSEKVIVATKDEFINELKQELSVLKSACEMKLENQQSSFAQQKTDMDAQFNAKVSELKSKVQSLSLELQTLQTEKEEEKDDFTKLVAVLENEKEASAKLIESHGYFQRKCEDLEDNMESATANIADMQAKIQDLQANISEKDKIIQAKDGILQLRNAESATINEKLKTSVSLLESTEAKVHKLQDAAQDLSNCKNQIVELKAKNSQLYNQVNHANAQLSDAQDKIEGLHSKLTKQRASYKVLLSKDESELNSLTHRLTKTQKEVSEQNQNNQYLRRLLQENKDHFAEEKLMLQNMIDKLKDDYDYELKSNQNNKQISSKQLQSENSKVTWLKLEIEKRDRLLSKLSMEVSKLKAELALKSANVPSLRPSQKTFHVIPKTSDQDSFRFRDKNALPFSHQFLLNADKTMDSITNDLL